jgi:PAS domain S-box-containing protein
MAVALLLSQAAPASADPSSITVVLDDNYPPYIFRDEMGELQGILKDGWALWSSRTGVAVRLEGLDWGEALRRFNAGEADVIDTIFRTEAREKIYDFSAPYATIDVPIFFNAELSGISDAATLHGFTVGVKDGDACIDFLGARHIDSFRRFGSYEALVEAAGRGEVKVFCIDKPPAAYFLMKKGLDDRFRASPPLYTGRFHRAVLKGNDDMRQLVEHGFAVISTAEWRTIEERWLGQAFSRLEAEELRNTARAVVMGGGLLALALLAWVWALRRQVAARTQALAASEKRFRTIFDDINDAIFIHDVDSGAILMTNRRASEMYGWEAGKLRGLTTGDLSEGGPLYGQAEAMQWIRRSVEGPQVFEWHARHKSGRLFWVEVALRRAAIDHGERVLVVVRDISDRKEAAEALNHSIAALTRSNADLERFAYAASHDLREPLNTVVRYSQLIEHRYAGRLDADADEFIGFMVRGAKQMLRLVGGLLEFSRIEGGGRQFTAVDANRALAIALDNLSDVIQTSGAKVTADHLPTVTVDEVQLAQLLQNLIGNAIKYRSPDRAPVVTVSAERTSDRWEFRVADNGIGIDPDYRDQVFVIFKRLHTKHAIPGEGIGLALCQRIVERHGGRIWVEAAPVEGTVFHFTLGG